MKKNEEKFLLFKLRTSMLNVKGNFSHSYEDISCDLCFGNEPQTQEHLLDCNAIIENCPQLYSNRNVSYGDLFEGPKRQLRCTQLFKHIIDAKEKLEEQRNSDLLTE